MTKHKIAVILVGVAALMLLFSTVTKTWFKVEMPWAEYRIGLLSTDICDSDGSCKSGTLEAKGSAKGRQKAFVIFGQVTFGLGLVSVLALGVVALLGFRRHDRALQIAKLGLILLTLTVCSGLIFIINKEQLFNPSLGVFLFMIGGMGGVIGTHMLSRQATYEETVRDPSIPRL